MEVFRVSVDWRALAAVASEERWQHENHCLWAMLA
jgi:hypothetical protein